MQHLTAVEAPWSDRRRRAQELLDRHSYAAEVLRLYAALIDVQERIYERALTAAPLEVAGYIAREAVPRVVEVTVAAGPPRLVESVLARFHTADLADLVGRWLGSAQQAAADRYLARAASEPVLLAAGPAALAACSGPRDSRHCPACGGLPQLSYFGLSDDPLLTGPRHLECSRCGQRWQHPRLVCAGCGEDRGARLPIYSDVERFPHIRVAGCETCGRYLLELDLRKDAGTVPVVDELAALPLDLYAKERALTKITPNLVGF